LDLFIFGRQVLGEVKDHPHLDVVEGDLRDQDLVRRSLAGCDAVVHLACISNDPSFELDPVLGKSINYDAFRPLVESARDSGTKRFILASSSSVYGVKEEERVTEDLPLEPLTDYSKYKALCEDMLRGYQSPDFTTVVIRPATVCGYSPRLRLDLTVNILTNHAYHNRRIRVFGGSQYRPNLHIEDMANLYVHLLRLPDKVVAGKTWNAGYENHSVRQIAEQVRDAIADPQVEIATEPTDDLRSYRICSDLIQQETGFVPRHNITDAARDLSAAFRAGKVPDAMSDPRYYNIKMMQHCPLE
jgi:nucleoside-diphosphate-sugar epimerase